MKITNESDYAVIVEINHQRDGMVEQGGVCGRVVRVNKKNVGMSPTDKLDDVINDSGCTWSDLIIEYVRSKNWYGDQTVKNGHIIR